MKSNCTKLAMTASLLALAGCSTLQPPVRQIAVDSNRVFAESADQQTFLNFLRAKDKLPMHYSSFRYFRGNVQLSGSASLGSSLVERGTSIVTNADGTQSVTGTQTTLSNGVDSFSPSLGISVMSNPNFETAYYDSKEFQNGILTPVTPSLIEFYLSQGWPDQFLSALFISSVNVVVDINETEVTALTTAGVSVPRDKSKDKTVKEKYPLDNDPSISQNGNFGVFIKFFELAHKEKKGKNTPLFSLNRVNDLNLGDLGTLDGTKFTVAINPEDADGKPIGNCEKDVPCLMRIGKSSRGITFKVRPEVGREEIDGFVPFPGNSIKSAVANLTNGKVDGEDLWINCSDFSIVEEAGTGKISLEKTSESKVVNGKAACAIGIQTSKEPKIVKPIGSLDLEVVFRSPQSVMYFLGKYLREQEIDPKSVYELEEGKCKYKLVMAKPSFGKNDLLRARHNGKDYAMPKPGNKAADGSCKEGYHRGSQALALAQQLINLHKSSENLPSTRALQIVP